MPTFCWCSLPGAPATMHSSVFLWTLCWSDQHPRFGRFLSRRTERHAGVWSIGLYPGMSIWYPVYQFQELLDTPPHTHTHIANDRIKDRGNGHFFLRSYLFILFLLLWVCVCEFTCEWGHEFIYVCVFVCVWKRVCMQMPEADTSVFFDSVPLRQGLLLKSEFTKSGSSIWLACPGDPISAS